MSASNKTKKSDETANVLYQKMNGRWYAFSVVEDEVYLGEVPEEFLQELNANPEAPETNA